MVRDEKGKKAGRLAALRKVKGQRSAEEAPSTNRKKVAASAPRSSPKKLTAFIKVFGSEEGRDRVYPLDKKDEYTVGRTSDADIPLADRKVSRKHCKIVRKGVRYFVLDLNSRNGTFLGGKKVKRRLLKDGDQIQVGMSRLLFFKAEKTEVVLQFAKERKCALCGRVVSQADLLSGKAEEVDGSVFCAACVAQAMGEEVVGGATPVGMTPPPRDVTLRMTAEEEAAAKAATVSPKHQPAEPSPPKGVKEKEEEPVERSAVLKKSTPKRKAVPRPPQKPAEKEVTVPPSSAPVERDALKERLRQAAKMKPKETEETAEVAKVSDFMTYEDVSTLKRRRRLEGRPAEETIYDEDAADLAALSEPPKIEDLAAFEDADVDKLIDELLEEE